MNHLHSYRVVFSPFPSHITIIRALATKVSHSLQQPSLHIAPCSPCDCKGEGWGLHRQAVAKSQTKTLWSIWAGGASCCCKSVEDHVASCIEVVTVDWWWVVTRLCGDYAVFSPQTCRKSEHCLSHNCCIAALQPRAHSRHIDENLS